MNILNEAAAEAAQIRRYSDMLDEEHRRSLAITLEAEDIADQFRAAWIRGEWAAQIPGSSKRYRPMTVAAIASEDLCDVPGNPLHDLLAVCREAALRGDKRAIEVFETIGSAHGLAVAEGRV